jgi:recombinase
LNVLKGLRCLPSDFWFDWFRTLRLLDLWCSHPLSLPYVISDGVKILLGHGSVREIEIVKRMFRCFVQEGKYFREIAAELNAGQTRTSRGLCWNGKTVGKILEKYASKLGTDDERRRGPCQGVTGQLSTLHEVPPRSPLHTPFSLIARGSTGVREGFIPP